MNGLRQIFCVAVVGLALGCSDAADKTGTNNVNNLNNTNNTNNLNNTNNTNNLNNLNNIGECNVANVPECDPGSSPDCLTEDIGSSWICSPCSPRFNSSLAGVEIQFPEAACTYFTSQLSEGVTIPYQIVVTQSHLVSPTSQQNGCDEAGPSGLRAFERIYGTDYLGNENQYCLCDVGLCEDSPIESMVQPGTYQGSISWEGRNWNGPSDTGNPQGEPFVGGSYTVEVKAIGETDDGTPYEVIGELPITIYEY